MIYLLDLNYTLVENSRDRIEPFTLQIEREHYRAWLVDLLRDERVILITARPAMHATATLEGIRQKTGWAPEAAFFNDLKLPPPALKRRVVLERIFPQYGANPGQYFALESNPRTRSMYAALSIRAQAVGEVPWRALPA